MSEANDLKVGIVLGSTRESRFADKPAQWLLDIARSTAGAQFELLDIREFELPFFAEAGSPMHVAPIEPAARRWGEALDRFDAFIIVCGEYNHGPPAALKNALDYAYAEYVRKPVGFVGYGGLGAARAIEQLRLVCVELQMAPVRNAVHISLEPFLAVWKQGASLSDFPHLVQSAQALLADILWWGNALKAARST